MPKPIAICIENLNAPSEAERYLRCVALGGRVPGLGLSPRGEVIWQSTGPAVELWVSGDERLMLLRPAGEPPVTVSRSGRSLAAPSGKPVVLVDGDELAISRRRLRVHIHGEASAVHRPSPLERSLSGVAAAAAVLAIGASTMGCPKSDIEVRDHPPEMPADPPVTATATPPASGSAPIEIREQPPDMVQVEPTAPATPPASPGSSQPEPAPQ